MDSWVHGVTQRENERVKVESKVTGKKEALARILGISDISYNGTVSACDCLEEAKQLQWCLSKSHTESVLIIVLAISVLVTAIFAPLCVFVDRIRLEAVLKKYVRRRKDKEDERLRIEKELKELRDKERERVEKERIERRAKTMSIVV